MIHDAVPGLFFVTIAARARSDSRSRARDLLRSAWQPHCVAITNDVQMFEDAMGYGAGSGAHCGGGSLGLERKRVAFVC